MKHFNLSDACRVDVTTQWGVFSLLMNPSVPHTIMVLLDGEPRCGLELDELPCPVDDEASARDCLQQITESSIFEDLVEDEKQLQEQWNEL